MASVPLRMVLILGALTAIGPISTDIYLPGFPAIARELAATDAAVQRTLAASFLGMALGQAFYGPLSDRFGRRWPLVGGMALFALASVGCALAPDIGWLTGLRLLQALGGCAGLVVSRAVVRDLAEGPAMVRLMTRLMLVFGLAPVLGPLLGGALLELGGWRAVFWLLAAYGAVMALSVALALGETLAPEQRQSGGVAQSLQTYGRLLRDRRFLGYALGAALGSGSLFAYIAGAPFVFMGLHGASPQGFAVLFGANAFGIMALAHVAGRLAHTVPPRRILVWAQALALGSGLVLLGVAATGWGGMWGLAAPLFCFVASLGGILPVATSLAMAPHGRVAGSASAVVGVLQFGLGAASGLMVSLLGDGTAVPMAVMVAGCAGAGLLLRAILTR